VTRPPETRPARIIRRARGAVQAEPEELVPRSDTDRALQIELRKQGREALRRAQDAIREAVGRDRRQKLSGLLEHLTIDVLRGAFYELKRKGAAGIDGTSWHDFEAGLEPRLEELHTRVQRGTYQALPGLRVRLPKPHGGYRPITSSRCATRSSRGRCTPF
jgi:RNA-directed DNA polymerase